jgi:peptidoglycan hydrolase-like protein with peptidoglycan-binding domain
VGRGGRGLTVTKLQQALIDLGYLLPKFGVDGKFEGETKAALLKFQGDAKVPPTGELDE